MIACRPYQLDVLRGVADAFAKGNKRPCVVIGCGGGKTVVAIHMANMTQRKGRDVLFLVHRKELLDQTIKTFDFCEVNRERIHVGMVKTVANHIAEHPKYHTIIVDEAHLSITPTYKRILEALPDAYVIGLTATPVRLDGRPLGEVYDSLVIGPQPRELINGEYLAPYRYYAPTVADLSALKRKGSDFDQEHAAELLSGVTVFGDVISHYRNLADGKKTICYCSSINHSKQMATAFCDAGYAAVHFDGDTPKGERDKIMQKFRDGEIQVLCNVNLISEGLDVKDCECCILLRPTMSTALNIQQSGRALRYLPGKTAVIIDHVGNVHRHGLPDEQHEWSLKTRMKKRAEYNAEGKLTIRTCLNCYSAYVGMICPCCRQRAELTIREIKNMREIELQEIKEAKKLEADRAVANIKTPDDCTNVAQLQAFARIRGYKPGWVWHQMQARGWKTGGRL